MANTMTVQEAAELWGLTTRRVSTLCKNGQIAGVEKQGRSWLIPASTPKPADRRIRSGATGQSSASHRDLRLPSGILRILLY